MMNAPVWYKIKQIVKAQLELNGRLDQPYDLSYTITKVYVNGTFRQSCNTVGCNLGLCKTIFWLV